MARRLSFLSAIFFVVSAAGGAPAVGDPADLGSYDARTGRTHPAAGAVDEAAYREFSAALLASNPGGLRALLDSGRLVKLEPGARGVVVERLLVVVASRAGDLADPCYRVRVTTGAHAGRSLLFMAELVSPTRARAETLLRAAANLERAGKLRGALEYYGRVVRDYPGTPEAVRAAAALERIKSSRPLLQTP
jgi:hypothetical protein